MNNVEDIWRILREESRAESGWHVRRIHPESGCTVLAGLRVPDGAPGVLLEVEAEAIPPGIRMPRSNGFDLEAVLLGHSHAGHVRLVLSLADPSYATVFAVLCADTSAAAAEQRNDREAVAAFIGRLFVWQNFMARHGPDGLSEAAIVGLMGEIYVLQGMLSDQTGLASAIAAWAGPRGEPNDFALPGGYIEVKASASQAPATVSISNADQLDPSRGRIALLHVRFRSSAEGETLPEMVAALRQRILAEAPSVIALFAAALQQAGYLDAQAGRYDMRLEAVATVLYQVDERFPHIGRGNLMAGVSECRYSVVLADCEPFRALPSFLAELINGGGG